MTGERRKGTREKRFGFQKCFSELVLPHETGSSSCEMLRGKGFMCVCVDMNKRRLLTKALMPA